MDKLCAPWSLVLLISISIQLEVIANATNISEVKDFTITTESNKHSGELTSRTTTNLQGLANGHEQLYENSTSIATTTTTFDTEDILDADVLKSLYENDVCKNYASCSFVVAKNRQYCKCDKDCVLYNDCCYDEDFLQRRFDPTITSYKYKCLRHSPMDKYSGVFVVESCPEASNPNLDSKCRSDNILDVGPWVANRNGTIFKNKFCAECHNVSYSIQLDVKVAVTDKTLVTNTAFLNLAVKDQLALLQNHSDVAYRIILPGDIPTRHCVPEFLTLDTPECKAYPINPIEVNFVPYRNAYCVQPEELQNGYKFCYGLIGLKGDQDDYNLYPLTVLFVFQDSPTAGMLSSSPGPSQIYYDDVKVIILFSLLANRTIAPDLLKQIIFMIATSISVQNKTRLFEMIAYDDYSDTDTNKIVMSRLRLVFFVTKMLTLEEMDSTHKRLQNLKWNMIIKHRSNNEVIEISTDVPRPTTKECGPVFVYYNYKTLSSSRDRINIVGAVSINKIPCSNIEIVSSLNGNTSTLTVEQVVCKEVEDEDSLSALVYITYIGITVSVISLFFSIFVLRKSGISDSIPGSNLENLSFVLIGADIIFAVGIGASTNQIACQVIGVVLHYLWLSVFCFMSVTIVFLVYDINHNIHKSSGDGVSAKSLCLYRFIGLGMPTLVVGPAVAVEWTKHSFAPHYGGSICFPTGYPGSLIFFGGPIMISLALNVVCLLFLIIHFVKHANETAKARKVNFRQNVEVYLRLSVITGMFWVTGILGSIFESVALNYIFVVLCSLHGFFIALSNLTTKRVRRHLHASVKLSTSSRSASF